MKGRSDISRDELRNGLRDGTLTVVDVLPEESYATDHIPGAINLPFENLADRARDLLPDSHAQIVVYCAKFSTEQPAARDASLLGPQLVAAPDGSVGRRPARVLLDRKGKDLVLG